MPDVRLDQCGLPGSAGRKMGANVCLHLLVTVKVILELRGATAAAVAAAAKVATARMVRRMATMAASRVLMWKWKEGKV